MAEQELKACPLQVDRHSRAGPLSIPWPIAEKAYSEYARRYGTSQSLARIAERGGFSWGEMDMLYPAWRTDTDAISALTARLSSAEAEVERLRAEVDAMGFAMLRIRRDAVTIDDAMTIIDPFDLTAAARRQQGGTDAS